ncbi:MAG: methyltransferase domain-containing protein [Candidatus Babeliales bacterium]
MLKILKPKIFHLHLLVQFFLLFSYIMSNQSNHHFAWNGENYDKVSSFQYKAGVEAIESFNLCGDEKILDIGCGNGKTAALCARKLTSGSLTAIDASSSMINFALEHYGNTSNLTFLLQDVVTMSFDQEFDLVYSLFCLHWVKDQEIAMKNIAKSLKPGGKAVLYISLPNKFNKTFKDEFNKIINSTLWSPYKDLLHYNHFPIPKKTWFKYAKNNNFEVKFKTIQDSNFYENYDKFKQRYIAYGLGAEILQVMGHEIGNQFVDCYLENVYKTLGLTKEQSIVWKMDILILILSTQH